MAEEVMGPDYADLQSLRKVGIEAVRDHWRQQVVCLWRGQIFRVPYGTRGEVAQAIRAILDADPLVRRWEEHREIEIHPIDLVTLVDLSQV